MNHISLCPHPFPNEVAAFPKRWSLFLYLLRSELDVTLYEFWSQGLVVLEP